MNLEIKFSVNEILFGLMVNKLGEVLLVKIVGKQNLVISSFNPSNDHPKRATREVALDIFENANMDSDSECDHCFSIAEKFVPLFFN